MCLPLPSGAVAVVFFTERRVPDENMEILAIDALIVGLCKILNHRVVVTQQGFDLLLGLVGFVNFHPDRENTEFFLLVPAPHPRVRLS